MDAVALWIGALVAMHIFVIVGLALDLYSCDGLARDPMLIYYADILM